MCSLDKGDYNKQVEYSDNPLEVAKQFEAAGITRLHIVDLDGANGAATKNLKGVGKYRCCNKLNN